jgi:hypothetical protein
MAVTPGTIAVALGRTAPDPDSTEFAQWSMWISDALMLISARLVGTETGQVATLAELDQDTLDYVVREAVVAQIRRPDDATSVDVRVDDGAVSRTYRSSGGRVSIRDEWWDLLSPSDSKQGAFSVVPYGRGFGHAPWCDLMFLGTVCSCGYTLTAGLGWIYEPAGDE